MDIAPEGGRLIGRGRTAAVYDVGDGLVLRRFCNPDYDATAEAHAMWLAASAGVPVPRVHKVAGRDMVMDRVDGPTMLDDLVAHPEHLDRHAATLADLHRQLDAVVIQDPKAKPEDPPTESATPVGLIHGDLHPANVLLTDTGPVLIDWTNHQFGPRGIDLADTWIVLACFGHDLLATAGVSSATRAALVHRFLTKIDQTQAIAWLRRAIELRLADPATGIAEQGCIHRLSKRAPPDTALCPEGIYPLSATATVEVGRQGSRGDRGTSAGNYATTSCTVWLEAGKNQGRAGA
jgi:aminoglycoside phosphotransferase (APT) family kinase protein